tara:strand:+ start:3144 stop:4214 length:1071 start_codon:yes stop_codon:yes gene_type:complete
MRIINGRLDGKEIYDVYYSTGGGSLVGGGSDVWVNHWIKEIYPKLKVKSILLIHRNRPERPSIEEQDKIWKSLNKDLDVYWQGDDLHLFGSLLNGARRINILHGYYAPHKYILTNKDKIHSNAVHVNVNHALNANTKLGLKDSLHFSMEPSWEAEIVNYAKYPFWIGIDPPKLKKQNEQLLHIPNFYEFKHNLDVTDNNIVGFASRMETRKCPHYLQRIPSMVCTNPVDVQWWIKNLKMDTRDWKIYKFNYPMLDKFYQQDWGISHSAHIYEPFGYSIFQALDYGKIPILSRDWLMDFDYPYRAFGMHEFYSEWQRVCDVSISARREWVFMLREYLKQKFGDKDKWAKQLLEIYNS